MFRAGTSFNQCLSHAYFQTKLAKRIKVAYCTAHAQCCPQIVAKGVELRRVEREEAPKGVSGERYS